MRDPVLMAARDPSCLMCLTPWQGGGWFSPIGGTVQPGPPRNFATETASWRDFAAVYNEQFVLGHSYRLVCRLLLTAAPAQNMNVFGGDVANPLSLAVYAAGHLNCSSRLLRTSSVEYVTIGSSQALTIGQWYDVSVFFRNNQMVLKIAGSEYMSLEGYAPQTITAPSIYVSDAPVNIENMEFWDDTTGKRMWSYPNEAERLRLITKSNIRTDRGAFEAGNTSVAARVDSRIDLRGIVSDYTVIVDFEAFPLTGASQKQELAGQGAAIVGQAAICSIGYYKTASTYNFQLSHEVAGVRAFYNPAISELSGRHTVAGRIVVGTSSTVFSILLDGKLVGTQTVSGLPTGVAYSTYTNYAVNDNRNGSWTNHFGKVYSVTLFNRALSDAEIKAFK